jgi:hypothetical protein
MRRFFVPFPLGNEAMRKPGHPITLPVLFLSLLMATAWRPAAAQGHSGIPEIDSLPLHDWSTSNETLSYAKTIGFSAVVPGGGQFYSSHPVRGGFLLGLETILGGLAIYSRLVDIPHYRDQAETALDSANALFIEQTRSPENAAQLEAQRNAQIEFARKRAQLAAQQQDLANSELAWALGLHAYGILDAAEIAYRSRHRDTETRSVRRAMTYGLIFPGGAQLYNDRYGKFGMLWMALGASAVSAASRQEMVDFLNDRLAVARAESDQAQITQLEKDRTLYRKRRNQYYWGMALLYVYAMLDGMVDAALSDFDAPGRFAFTTGPRGTLACEWRVPF